MKNILQKDVLDDQGHSLEDSTKELDTLKNNVCVKLKKLQEHKREVSLTEEKAGHILEQMERYTHFMHEFQNTSVELSQQKNKLNEELVRLENKLQNCHSNALMAKRDNTKLFESISVLQKSLAIKNKEVGEKAKQAESLLAETEKLKLKIKNYSLKIEKAKHDIDLYNQRENFFKKSIELLENEILKKNKEGESLQRSLKYALKKEQSLKQSSKEATLRLETIEKEIRSTLAEYNLLKNSLAEQSESSLKIISEIQEKETNLAQIKSEFQQILSEKNEKNKILSDHVNKKNDLADELENLLIEIEKKEKETEDLTGELYSQQKLIATIEQEKKQKKEEHSKLYQVWDKAIKKQKLIDSEIKTIFNEKLKWEQKILNINEKLSQQEMTNEIKNKNIFEHQEEVENLKKQYLDYQKKLVDLNSQNKEFLALQDNMTKELQQEDEKIDFLRKEIMLESMRKVDLKHSLKNLASEYEAVKLTLRDLEISYETLKDENSKKSQEKNFLYEKLVKKEQLLKIKNEENAHSKLEMLKQIEQIKYHVSAQENELKLLEHENKNEEANLVHLDIELEKLTLQYEENEKILQIQRLGLDAKLREESKLAQMIEDKADDLLEQQKQFSKNVVILDKINRTKTD